MGHSHGAALFGLGLGNAPVGFRLIHLKLGAHVAAHVHIRDIDGQNFKGRARIQALAQHRAANQIRVFQNLFMGIRRAHGGYNTFTHAGDDGFLTCAAHQSGDIGPNRDPRLGAKLDAILGDGGHHRRLDDLGINAHLDGLKHVPARQVDGAALFKFQRNGRGLRGNQRVDHPVHVTTGQEMGFHFVHIHVQAGLGGLDIGLHNLGRIDPPEAHTNQGGDVHLDARGSGRYPQAQRKQIEEHQQHHNKGNYNQNSNPKRFHRLSPSLSLSSPSGFSAFNFANHDTISFYPFHMNLRARGNKLSVADDIELYTLELADACRPEHGLGHAILAHEKTHIRFIQRFRMGGHLVQHQLGFGQPPF